jgi:hypothetical protein
MKDTLPLGADDRRGVLNVCSTVAGAAVAKTQIKEKKMAKASEDDIPEIEEPEPLDPEDAAEIAPLDSEIDFDDEQEEDQAPLDVAEASELGVLLDDPESLSDEEE